MAAASSAACTLCGRDAVLVSDAVRGYREGQEFAIYACSGCTASFASPLAADDSIYQHIYRQIDRVFGYDRYARYAREVLGYGRALDYLGRQEESYWAVGRHLRRRRLAEGELRILEVGCGMGYFTYALHQDGFPVLGVDISSEALSRARDSYGPFYSDASLQELQDCGQRYDAIVMNQLLEHIPDVHGQISGMLPLLKPNGELLLTTPNKSAYPGADWETELPPVHLWWFSEDSIRILAERHGCSATFVDFAPYYRSHYRKKMPPVPLRLRTPVLDARGDVVQDHAAPDEHPVRQIMRRSGLMTGLNALRARVQGKDAWKGARGPICAAILRHGGSVQ